MMNNSLTKPPRLKIGDTIGIFTPSFPAHVVFRDKYLHGINQIKELGFNVIEGKLTASLKTQGYRTSSGKDRADELMSLFLNKNIQGIVSTIGGSNSSSMLDHLDFEMIKAHPKVFCGYSDVTSLHMAINKFSNLSTFYGPAVMPSFGEYPHFLDYSKSSFLAAVGMNESIQTISPPKVWSRHIRDIPSGDWKIKERSYIEQPGWNCVNFNNTITGPIVVANLNTLLKLTGTKYFPDFNNKIIILEEMSADFDLQERQWTQVKQIGMLSKAKALIVSKPEKINSKEAPFSYQDLIEEALHGLDIPRVYNFDCGHTSPMITLAQGTNVELKNNSKNELEFKLIENMVI